MGSTRRRAAIVLLLAAFLAAGALFLHDPESTGDSARYSARLSILLVTLDTTRADHLSAYGYARPTSPHLEALARRGVRFATARAQAPNTPVSHASILTGLVPFRHGLTRMHGGSARDFDPPVPTMAEVLARAGYRTGAFVSAFPAGSHFGLDRGFGSFDESYPVDPGVVAPDGTVNTGLAQRASGATVERAIAWLDASGERARPFFLWVHLFDPHDPRVRPDEADRYFFSGARSAREGTLSPDEAARYAIDLYDAEIRVMDRELGRLVEAAGDQTLVAVVADHGEGLGDHGWWSHGNLYEEQLRVPMLLAGPGCEPGLVVETPVRTVDLAPSLYELAGVAEDERPSGTDGVSLAPTVRGLRPDDAQRIPFAYAEVTGQMTYRASWNPAHESESRGEAYAIVEGNWKIIVRRTEEGIELYDLATDPTESLDRSRDQPERVRRMARILADLGAESRVDGAQLPLSPDARRWLQTLGYGGE